MFNMFNKTGEEYIAISSLYDSVRVFDHCCGIYEFGGFEEFNKDSEIEEEGCSVSDFERRIQGAGLIVTTFNNTKACKDAYMWLASKYKLVSQTPLYYNKQSHNRIFLAVWDVNSKK